MQVWMQVAIACLVAWRGSDSSGAGRALPVEAENFVIELFKGINPDIEWDRSNFLVDLAGVYANCDNVREPVFMTCDVGQRGFMTVNRTTPGGDTIVAIVGNIAGTAADGPSVTRYVKILFRKWMEMRAYEAQIRRSDFFGCSVRPACSGQAVVSCLFSPAGEDAALETPTHPNVRIVRPPQDEPEGVQWAFPFTQEEYEIAENLTGKAWDRSHFLENLSGFETDCAMLYNENWVFAYAHRIASQRGHQVVGLYGHARNNDSTTDAMRQIFHSFKQLPHAYEVGCSLLPVVVSCLYMVM